MVTLLDQLEEAARGPGTITYLPASPEPQPISTPWRQGEDAARWLAARVDRGGAVAMVLTTHPACSAALLGAWRSGLTVASLPTPGRGMPVEEYVEQTTRICELVGADLLLMDAAYLAFVPDTGLRVHAFDDVLAGGPDPAPEEIGSLVQFTSGSTSTPKGVHLSMEAIAANIESILEQIKLVDDTVAVSWLPLSHDMGLIGMFLAALVSAAPSRCNSSLVLISPESFLSNPSVWLKTCSQFGGTCTTAPNFAFELATRTSRWSKNLDLSSLQVVITGAERVRAETLRRFSEALGPAGFDSTALCPAYGLAEASLAVTIVEPAVHWTSLAVDTTALADGRWVEVAPGDGTELVSNGGPLPRMQYRVVGDDSGVGEIEISGPSMLHDYVGADLRLTPDGWFPTKDLGRVVDGELYITGRLDDMLVIAGRNFYASDLEAVAGRLDLVRSGSCAVVTDEEGSYAVVAEPRRGVIDLTVLEDGCRQIKAEVTRTAGAAASKVIFVEPGTIPKTPSGKLQRFRVRRALEDGALATMVEVDFGGRSGGN
jgi:acyl-CoA synthetase (AMP-forming)/AMP-acid ligase II